METKSEEQEKARLEESKTSQQGDAKEQDDTTLNDTLSSAYLWKGYMPDLNVKTYDLFSQSKVKAVALGSKHSLFLLASGSLYALGSNEFGQLGQGSLEVNAVDNLVQVGGLTDSVTAIACGTAHNAVVTSSGQVFCWGNSSDGQCGTGSLDIVLEPMMVPIELNNGFCQHGIPNTATRVSTKAVSCGASHTLALSCDGEVWSWGAGPQLGLGELQHAPVPRRLDSLCGKVAVAVCCGDSHSLVLVLSSKKRGSVTPNSSPAKNKNLVSASSTHPDKNQPSKCSICNSDMYSFTESNGDTCVVNATHECKEPRTNEAEVSQNKSALADSSIFETPQTSIEDAETHQQSSQNPTKSIVGEDYSDGPSLINMSVSEVDMSTLTVAEQDPFEEADPPEGCNTSNDDSLCNQSTYLGDGKPDANISGSDTVTVNDVGNSAVSKAASCKIEDQDDKKQQLEDEGAAGSCSPQPYRPRSSSNVSSGSLSFLNQSEALQYLQRQFKDEEEEKEEDGEVAASSSRAGSEGTIPSTAAGTPKIGSGKRNLSFDNVLGYSSSMMSQMKSMTSRAFTNIGSLSLFGSSGQLSDGDSKKEKTGDGAGGAASRALTSSAGSSSLSSALRDSPDSGISASNTSDSLSQWCKDMRSTNPDTESMAEGAGKGQRSLRTIQMQQRNLSASRMASVGTSVSEETWAPIVTATEVWVWGNNDRCQLGLGDQLNRSSPVEMRAFRGRHVVKLAAGHHHNLALTTNSQVFSWGSNSYGQLGQMDDAHSPMRIKLAKGFLAWDIAAGSYHSILLGDSAERIPAVYYSGRQPSEGVPEGAHVSNRKTIQFVALPSVNKLGWFTGLSAGGEDCACVVLNPPLPETRAVFELAAREREFYNRLTKTSNILLRPLQSSELYTAMDIYPYQPSLRNMVQAFGFFTKKLGESLTDQTRCMQSEKSVMSSRFVQLHEEFMQAFRSYSQAFSDMLAVGGFEFCTKSESQLFEKVQTSYRGQSDERGARPDVSETFFQRAMAYPFFRIQEYVTVLDKIAQTIPHQNDSSVIQEVSLKWAGLMKTLAAEHKAAKATRSFWTVGASKAMVDALCIPSRRLLRDSKTHHLHWPAGTKFSSRLFVLFNDIFVLSQGTSVTSYPLETVWVEPGSSESEHLGLTVITPDERFDLVASSPDQKTQWIATFNSAINEVLSHHRVVPPGSQAGSHTAHGAGEQSGYSGVTAPLVRHAPHKFVRSGPYKDAVYNGSWFSGKVDGQGSMKFADGSVYDGYFKRGLMHGPGAYTVVRPGDTEIQKGHWIEGKLNGLATVSYSNGDQYRGYFQKGQRFGHGIYKSGSHKRSSCTSIYVGEWNANLRDGYGVQDDILKGEKYMGMWADDQRHGNGVLVTLDGMYFEGNFVLNKLQGFGVMISDDNTVYEGDFMGTTHLSGKGTLSLPTGDRMEGSFSGSLNGGLKVNGIFHKSATSPDNDGKHIGQGATTKSKYFGRLCVSADNKWTDIFSHAAASLGYQAGSQAASRTGQAMTEKAWEMVAISVSAGKKALQKDDSLSASKAKAQLVLLDDLEKIPAARRVTKLDRETVEEIASYLAKAFDAVQHPLGRLMESVVEVFRASYIGVGNHPRLLPHAVSEIQSYVRRIYGCVRLFFPTLPANGGPLIVHPSSILADSDKPAATHNADQYSEQGGLSNDDMEEDPNMLVFTSAGLIYPVLLPKIYPSLFDLYALYNERSDDMYWERVKKLNRQSDMGLMAYLGLEQRFWLMDNILKQDPLQRLSAIQDICYAEAVDILQQLSTAFSPIEKLKVIEETFNEITKTVNERVSGDVVWCMDDLFPIFQFVVVRAKLKHLGAEIHLMEELMEPHLEHGELGIMLTTLKACYFQIQNEKMPHH